jgi:hypothetical protein
MPRGRVAVATASCRPKASWQARGEVMPRCARELGAPSRRCPRTRIRCWSAPRLCRARDVLSGRRTNGESAQTAVRLIAKMTIAVSLKHDRPAARLSDQPPELRRELPAHDVRYAAATLEVDPLIARARSSC